MQLKQLDSQNSRRMKPLPRIPRATQHNVEEGDGHLWAVSYADLLMVLMSFFIIFFSFTDSKEDSTKDGLLQLAMGFQNTANGLKNAEVKSVANGTELVAKTAGTVGGNVPGTLLNTVAFKNLGALVTEEGKFLYIQLPDDIFGSRKFSLDKNTEKILETFYKVLKDQQNNLEIIVIGHSDSSQMSGHSNPYLSDNFDLSSLRALRALQFLIKMGFPQSNLSAQGSADGIRSSRSLSLRIQLKESSK